MNIEYFLPGLMVVVAASVVVEIVVIASSAVGLTVAIVVSRKVFKVKFVIRNLVFSP